eukprot:scaffold7377_cov389-Prasinococcus_capsulatus_cf.AAC.31
MAVHNASLPYDELLSSPMDGMDVDTKRPRETASYVWVSPLDLHYPPVGLSFYAYGWRLKAHPWVRRSTMRSPLELVRTTRLHQQAGAIKERAASLGLQGTTRTKRVVVPSDVVNRVASVP